MQALAFRKRGYLALYIKTWFYATTKQWIETDKNLHLLCFWETIV